MFEASLGCIVKAYVKHTKSKPTATTKQDYTRIKEEYSIPIKGPNKPDKVITLKMYKLNSRDSKYKNKD